MEDREFGEILWEFHNAGSDPERCDLILGLGSYDLRVADHCADLYQSGIAERVVFSGAEGNWTRGRWKSSEALVFRQRAIEKGVPQRAILTESKATNIAENLDLSRRLLQSNGIPVSSLTIVTKPNTLRRVRATLPLRWAEVSAYLSAPPITLGDQITEKRTLRAMVEEMVGDLQRLLVYPQLGFSVEQSIPPDVLDAYWTLVERGYVGHLMKGHARPERGKLS